MNKFFIFSLFSFSLMADIVVIQLKPNWSTVEATKRAAEARGEKVISYPKSAGNPYIDATGIQKIFEEIERSGRDISSIVFSGHDGSGNFFGDYGDVYSDDVQKALEKTPRLKNSVKSLVLRGCYSATKNQIMSSSDWRESFPNLDYIFGFDGAAPSSERPHSKNFVEGVLKLEHEHQSLNSSKELKDLLLDIELFKYTGAAAWHQSQCGREFYYSQYHPTTNGEELNLNAQRAACNGTAKKAERDRYRSVVKKFMEGKEVGFYLPPTQHQGTELRSAYAFIQANQHCVSMGAWTNESIYQPERVLSLIYFDYIRDNFMTNQKFDNFNTTIQGLVARNNMTIRTPADFKNASRQQWAQYQHDVNRFITSSAGQQLRNTNSKQYTDLYNMNRMLKDVIVDLNYNVIPNEWIDSHHSNVAIQY